jgi:pyruvate/2-oxoglutarate dehydrogenase complex dihydrolipoamide dehydrogenase (E3) component
MKKNKYDVIVIGGGSGGLNVASFFARIQMSVLLVDKNEESLGGDCLNTGCVPSKALIHIASLCKASRSSHKYGLTSQGEVDIALIMNEIKRKQGIIRAHENSTALEEKGIDVVLGKALFTGRNSVSVNGESFVFKKCVLATGSRARMLDIQNDMSVRMFSNETIFDIDYLPKQFVFIGGGPISCELGQAFARLGSHVTILNTQDRIVPRELQATSEILSSSFQNDGITIINKATITKIQDQKVYFTTENDETMRELSTDAIFVGIGRVLNVEGLDLENALVETDEKKTKVLVNEYLQTTNPVVYTVGDIAGSFMFTHTAEEHAKVVINNMVSPLRKKMPITMPWVTYTSPQIATFGKGEADLDKDGVWYEVLETSFEDEDRAITDDAQIGFVRVYIDKKGLLLGGTMVGDDAGELIQELLLLHTLSLPLLELYKKAYPYPTKSRINRKLVAGYLSRRLTYRNSVILRLLFKIKSLF